MKKLILLAGVALAFVGCNQGGTEDQYDTGRGTVRSANTNQMNRGAYERNNQANPNSASANSNLNIEPKQ